MIATPRFELDAAVRRRDHGRLLVGGTPPRLLRLSEAGARTLDAVLGGDAEPTAASEALVRRLERHGIIHPLPGDGADDPSVTVIVPVLDGGEPLAELVTALVAEGPVVVVDDGSGDGSARLAEAAGARVLRHASTRGPAAARNAGLAVAATDLVAFIDADCEVSPGWRRGLADLFAADPDLALVAPRVRSAPGDGTLARYEEVGSPLDLGPDASLVGPGRRVAYLPAAALVGRRDALRGAGGFDESMRFGEDVDLVWRMLKTGGRVRYAPSREVRHRPRPTVTTFACQRAGYGGSAPELVRRHGKVAAPLQASRHSAAIWAAAALLGPRGLLPTLAASTALVARHGTDRPSRGALAAVALRGQGDAAGHLARVLTREWLPLSLATVPFSRRARRLLLAAFVVDSIPVLSATKTPTDLVQNTALHVVDRAAYATGLWAAALRLREPAALVPSWITTRAT